MELNARLDEKSLDVFLKTAELLHKDGVLSNDESTMLKQLIGRPAQVGPQMPGGLGVVPDPLTQIPLRGASGT